MIRRVALAPNHYALGMVANGMSVWDVDDAAVETLGAKVGALEFVSHCYLRPARAARLALQSVCHAARPLTGPRSRQSAPQVAPCWAMPAAAHDILYSTRILKKTGLRLTRRRPDVSSDTIHARTGRADPGAPPRRPGQAGGDLEPDAHLQPEMPPLLYHHPPMCPFRASLRHEQAMGVLEDLRASAFPR